MTETTTGVNTVFYPAVVSAPAPLTVLIDRALIITADMKRRERHILIIYNIYLRKVRLAYTFYHRSLALNRSAELFLHGFK
jgi:hypothetical protein